MKKPQIIAIAAAMGVFATATVATAFAFGGGTHTIECPNCGAEIEMPEPERGRHMGPMSAEEMQAELEEKVANGEITQEEADERLAEWEAREAERQQQEAARQAELEDKVANGELTQEEADRLLQGPAGKPGGPRGKGPMDMQAELEEKVANGELTQEEADEQLAEWEANRPEPPEPPEDAEGGTASFEGGRRGAMPGGREPSGQPADGETVVS